MKLDRRLVVLSAASLLGGCEALSRAGPGEGMPRGTGIFLRIDAATKEQDQALFRKNPTLDAVLLMTRWSRLEPNRGEFALEPLRAEVNRWGQAGKGVVLALMPYGQSADRAQQTPRGAHPVLETPPWLYRDPGCSLIEFTGGGGAQGARIALPQVWKEGFAETYLEPLIAALARTFDGDPHVWYVRVGFGHIGHLTAQPSPDGSRAFLDAGWTAEQWGNYCRRVVALYQKHFRKTPLLLTAEKLLLRDRARHDYQAAEAELLREFAGQGVSIIHLGLVEKLAGIRPIYADLKGVIPLARSGKVRLGIGDDWPLWVPPSRRGQRPTVGHDEQFLAGTLPYAFGGFERLPRLPTTILYLQPPEIMVADPGNRRRDELGYNREVFTILQRSRARLKANAAASAGP